MGHNHHEMDQAISIQNDADNNDNNINDNNNINSIFASSLPSNNDNNNNNNNNNNTKTNKNTLPPLTTDDSTTTSSNSCGDNSIPGTTTTQQSQLSDITPTSNMANTTFPFPPNVGSNNGLSTNIINNIATITPINKQESNDINSTLQSLYLLPLLFRLFQSILDFIL